MLVSHDWGALVAWYFAMRRRRPLRRGALVQREVLEQRPVFHGSLQSRDLPILCALPFIVDLDGDTQVTEDQFLGVARAEEPLRGRRPKIGGPRKKRLAVS